MCKLKSLRKINYCRRVIDFTKDKLLKITDSSTVIALASR